MPPVGAFRKLLNAPFYQNLCDEAIAKSYWKSVPAKGAEGRGEYNALVKEVNKKNWLQAESLVRLLQAANDRYGTEFEFAYVLEGYRGRYNKGKWEADFEEPTRVSSLVSNEANDRPIILVWNNNSDSRAPAHSKTGTRGGLPHWEAFAAPRNKEIRADADRRERVLGWNVRREMDVDVNNGIWQIIEDCAGLGLNELSVRVGHFVRPQARDPSVVVPEGWRYV